MARAAGNNTHYQWPCPCHGSTDCLAAIALPSVTSIIKGVFGQSFTPASKWGFKLGLRAAFPDMPDDEFEKALSEAYDSDHSPENVRDSAATRGTLTHDYLEALVEAWTYETDPDVEPTTPYQESVRKWWDTEMKGWIPAHSEVCVRSLNHLFVGTVDLIRHTAGKTKYEVLDLKTHSGSARYEDRLQIAAYELAAREMGLIPADAETTHRVVLARKDGKKAGQSVKYQDPADFLAVKAVYDRMKGGS